MFEVLNYQYNSLLVILSVALLSFEEWLNIRHPVVFFKIFQDFIPQLPATIGAIQPFQVKRGCLNTID